MKLLATWLLTVALAFCAVPLCATPALPVSSAIMSDCDHSANGHEGTQGQQDQDALRMCHACIFQPVAGSGLPQPALHMPMVQEIQPASQHNGAALKPPVPPPRFANVLSVR